MRQISTGRVFAHDPHFLERDDFEEFDDEAQDPKPEEQAASDDAPKRRGRPPKSPE
jgi:hypothetical protein